MRILFCGDRNWDDAEAIGAAFDSYEVSVCIEGTASGADTMAGEEARRRGIPVEEFPAQWHRYGRGAGPVRNQQMLDEGKPDLVIAFHHDLAKSRGTASMVKLATKAGVPVEVVS